jgi:hypothetical protein
MHDIPAFYVARGSDHLGEFTIAQIVAGLAQGTFVPTDMIYSEETQQWTHLLPRAARRSLFHHHGENDNEWTCYYLREGAIYGPRLSEEIKVLAEQGFLTDDTLVTFLGSEHWFTVEEAFAEERAKQQSQRHLSRAKANFSEGNLLGAAASFAMSIVTQPTNDDPEDPEEVNEKHKTKPLQLP